MSGSMLRIAVLTLVGAAVLVLVLIPDLNARPALPGESGGGGGGGRWYSAGTVMQNVSCTTLDWEMVLLPPPPHLSARLATTFRPVFYLQENCYADPIVNECTPGTTRRTFQSGGC